MKQGLKTKKNGLNRYVKESLLFQSLFPLFLDLILFSFMKLKGGNLCLGIRGRKIEGKYS